MNIEDAANKLVSLLNNQEKQAELKDKMSERISCFSSFEKYFYSTVDFLEEVATGKV